MKRLPYCITSVIIIMKLSSHTSFTTAASPPLSMETITSILLQNLVMTPTHQKSSSYKRIQSFTQNEAISIIDNILFPINQYKQRLRIARDAQFKELSGSEGGGAGLNKVLSASDPILSFTYDEFPPLSMDQLLDIAIDEYIHLHNGLQPNVLVDLGSGCGRLVLHAALCKERGTNNSDYRDCQDKNVVDPDFLFKHVHGIEISEELYNIGIYSLEIGTKEGYFVQSNDNDMNNYNDNNNPSVQLHLGAADKMANILNQADIIFSYSTVFPTKGFDEELGAMILADEWSKMLADKCKRGCVVVTTDRALNPSYGWQLKQSLSVENPKLFGTIGYVSILQ